MDPLSQGLCGAALAVSFSKRSHIKQAAVCGLIGGMAPDLDILIRSAEDPLLAIEYHRHFTHSLAFIPFGGLLVACVLWLLSRRGTSEYLPIYLYTSLGFATHGLLDACTSYGTRLLWPFSDIRISWNIISIIDPIFTLTLLIFLLLCLFRNSIRLMRVGSCLALLYLGYGAITYSDIKQHMLEIAQERGHAVDRIILNPTIGNNILWRSVYQSGDLYYIDAVYAPPFTPIYVHQGTSIEAIDKHTIFPELGTSSTQRNDILRFAYFSQDYIYLHPAYEHVIGDLRYGRLPHDTNALWGIELFPDTPHRHADFKKLRQFEGHHYDQFWLMLNGLF